MSKLFFQHKHFALMILLLTCNYVAVNAQFAGGTGTSIDPWTISTPQHLSNIRDFLGAANDEVYFLQINDINLGVEPWNADEGWQPLGFNNVNSFRGNYDGGFYTISNMTINRENRDNIGLFGYINSAVIENVILEDIAIVGQNSTGGIAGYNLGGTIRKCSVSGELTGRDSVGGIAGIINLQGHIEACSNTTLINGRLRVGGITGSNFGNSIVRNSFSTGDIDGLSGSIGGLVGRSQNSLTEFCYSTGRVSTPSPFLGGLIGSQNEAVTRDSYWDVQTSELDSSMGGEGRSTEQMTYPHAENTFVNWDFESLWRADGNYNNNNGYPFHFWSIPGIPSNLTAETGDGVITLRWRSPLLAPDEYNIYRDGQLLASTAENVYEDRAAINYYRHLYYVTAVIEDEESEPSNSVSAVAHPQPAYEGSGTAEDPYLVESAGQLSFMMSYGEDHFLQTANIDLGVYPWNSEQGWFPIGFFIDFEHPENLIFSGSFNGNGHTISNLTINNPDSNYQGLFGYVQNAELKDIHLRNLTVKGNLYVGGLAGYARDTTIDESSVQGYIEAASDYAGGLVGYSIGLGNYISNCFADVNVYGAAYVGGLVGYSTTTTYSITNCYATGSVGGTSNCVGGLVGYSWGEIRNSLATSFVATTDTVYIGGLVGRSDFGRVVNSYWNTETSDQLISAGGNPMSTLELLQRDSYENWDFTNIWTIVEGVTYPWFAWQEIHDSHNIPGPYRLKAVPGSAVVRLSWQPPPVGIVDRYKVYRDNELISEISAPSTHFTNTGVVNYSQYRYHVVAILDDEQTTSPSNPAAVIPFTFAGGDGTINDPYLVDSAHQLHAVKSQIDCHFRQIADIDLSGLEWSAGKGWEPIGTTAVNSFTGTYNGGGHLIINMTINDPGTDYQGLFGYVRGGVIRNIGIINSTVVGRDNVGGLAGRVSDGSLIENCFYYGSVTGTGVDIGGLIGTNRFSRINKCFSYGMVRANSHNVGGLVGWNEASIIENSYSMADVEVTPLTDFLIYDVGGLVGFNINDSIIRNCRAGGNVSAVLGRRIGGLVGDNSLTDGELGSVITDSYATGNVAGDSWVGGLVGRNFSTPAAERLSEIVNSYSTGIVFSYSHNIGGLVGRNDNAIINSSYSTSTVRTQNSNGPYNQGGLVGRNTIGGEVNNCYAKGDVIGFARVGGLVGDNFRDTGDEVFITNSYATGLLTRVGNLPMGGLTARNEGGFVVASYWDRETTQAPNSAAGEGRTTEDMSYPYGAETYSNWDFERIWKRDELGIRNEGYPYFYWQKFVNHISIRGDREVSIPLTGIKMYEYDFRIYDHTDAEMTGSTVFWHLEDAEGDHNIENGFVTVNPIGIVTVSSNAELGSFTIIAVSDANSEISARLDVELRPTEISPNPAPGINPEPQNRAEAVEVTLEQLRWDYIENIAHQNPLGFRVYFGKSDTFDTEYDWVGYYEDQTDYSFKIPYLLESETTYYWKVVPTTVKPEERGKSKTRGRHSTERSSMYLRGDAQNCPVWSFTTDIVTDIEEEQSPVITKLNSNYPNPFNPETVISFSLSEPADVKIDIFNSRGRKVITLYDEYTHKGHHKVAWNGKDNYGKIVASGIYFSRMKSGDYRGYDKMLLMK